MTDDKFVLVHDAATTAFDDVAADGITVDEDSGQAEFDWNEVPVVELQEPPHARAFDTNEFYKIEGATVARPIRQPYRVGDDVDIYVKPADELRDAAWSMDNRPFVLGHPSTGMVKDTSDVHGFWRNPRYDGDEDRLREDLYIPKGDAEAKAFVEENQDVSLGFYNRVYSDYDGDIGSLVDTEEEPVDGFQVNIYTDHIAGVERGRCSSAHGCGLDDDHDHGTVVLRTDETTSFLSKEGQTKNEEDRGPLEERIKRKASDLGCDVPGSEESNDSTMGDTDPNDDTGGFDLPDLSIDALAEKHDDVRELRETNDELESDVEDLEEDLDAVREGLGLDEDECPCEADLDSYTEAKETVETLRDEFDGDVDLVDFVQDMHEEWQEARDEEREDLLSDLEELKADREEWEDADIEDLREERDRRAEIAEDFDASGISEGSDADETEHETFEGKRVLARGEHA